MMDQSGSAMQAERMRAEVVAANMANAETTKTETGEPYQRQHIVFAAAAGDPGFAGEMEAALPAGTAPLFVANALAPPRTASKVAWPGLLGNSVGNSPGTAPAVRIAAVVQDKGAALKRFDPSHPDADAEGYVSYPDINPLTEMVDLMGATRAYGLNASAVQAEKQMIGSALEIAK
jgi:flagellar basal-body rod protein FlgC